MIETYLKAFEALRSSCDCTEILAAAVQFIYTCDLSLQCACVFGESTMVYVSLCWQSADDKSLHPILIVQ